jgi:hypothetical protein
MLVIDDFNELVGLETLFRRLGFDVLSLSRESLVPESVLGFPPDLAIATGRGRHVDGFALAPKHRYGTSAPKLVVLLPQSTSERESLAREQLLQDGKADAVIETPFDPKIALTVVAKLLGLQAEPLWDKYSKIVTARLFEPEELKIIKHPGPAPEPIIHVTSNNTETQAEKGAFGHQPEDIPVYVKEPTARELRYKKFIEEQMQEELPPMMNQDVLRDARARLIEQEKNESPEEAEKMAQLNREKREFVRAMIATAIAKEGEDPQGSNEP